MCTLFLQECARRFPVQLYGHDNSSKQDKFVLSVPPDQLKCVVTLTGDSITHAVGYVITTFVFILPVCYILGHQL